MSHDPLEISRFRAGAGAGAGAGVGAGADKKMYEYWPSPLCGVWVETCHLWISEKWGGICSIAAQNKIGPASLAVPDQLICS